MRRLTFALVVIALLACAGPASAGVVFDNMGTTNNFNVDAWSIQIPFWVADTFTLGSPTTVTGVNFWVWKSSNDPVTSVQLSIISDVGLPTDGTTLYTADASTPGVSVTDTFVQNTSSYLSSYYIDKITFSTGGISLGTGTYWLELTNAVSSPGNLIWWDQSDGNNSIAWERYDDTQSGYMANTGSGCWGSGAPGTTCTESFQVLNADTTAPEPGSLMLFGSGVLLLAGAWRRKFSR
jgi:PEP-CTERM motif